MTKGERTRSRLLERAAAIIAQQGIQSLTARSLADEANVSLGLVSHYFPDLGDIMFAVTTHIFEVAPFEQVDRGNPLTQIEDLVKRNFAYFGDNPDYYRCLLLSYYYAAFDRRFRKLHMKNFESVRKRIVRLLKQANHYKPNEIAGAIMELIEGSLLFTMVEDADWRSSQKRVLNRVREWTSSTSR